MGLQDLKDLIRRHKLVAQRSYPEVGAEDPVEMLMDVAFSGKKIALVFGVPEDTRAAPFRILPIHTDEVIRDGAATILTESSEWGSRMWTIRPATKAETPTWDAIQADYDNYEEEALFRAREELRDLAKVPVANKVFKAVRWSRLRGTTPFPAGTIGVDKGKITVSAFDEFADDAVHWETRYESVPKDALDTISSVSGRDEIFSAPERVRASSFASALERLRYEMAKSHYERIGQNIYG